MNDSKPSPKFAVSDGPVNLRHRAPVENQDVQDSPVVLARIQATLARQRLRIRYGRKPHGQGDTPSNGLSTGDIVTVVGGSASGVGLGLGVIQGSILLGGVCLLGLAGFGLRGFLVAKARRLNSPSGGATGRQHLTVLVDANDVAQLDVSLDKLAFEAPQDLLDRLARLKDLIAQCVALVTSSGEAGALGNDDSLFIRETVRRYLPDSVTSYLQVPQKDRASLVIDEGKTASDLIHEQLGMIEQKLLEKEARLTQAAGESLMRQQRFLSAKTRTPNR